MPPDQPAPADVLTVRPIGLVRTHASTRIEAPRQPGAGNKLEGQIELYPGHNFEHALQDLEGWDFIWVVFWFHHNSSWRPKVLPPRSSTGRKGVFATRAPYRPNPIGLSALRLERIDGLVLHVRGVDMLDGTPVIDIKPYVPYTDAHPAARSGWLEESARIREAAGTPVDPVRRHEVVFSATAAEQARWIESHTGLPMQARIIAVLSMGPEPHPYRRIRREEPGYRLALKEWRIHFRLEGKTVLVDTISSGYRSAQLDREGDEAIAAHRIFREIFRS